jgi:hypothetical protein
MATDPVDPGAAYKPILDRDTSASPLIWLDDLLTWPLLTRLEPLLNTLHQKHDALRQQNERIVATGVAMEQMLKPMEDGIRVRRERKISEDAKLAGKGGAFQGAEGTEGTDPRVDAI